MTLETPLTGGCQCGAVRFSVSEIGRASICFCRMCQKASGSIGGAFVSAKAFTYTRGSPSHFQSSSRAKRGFCSACGTPLTFETARGVDFSIAAFDRAGDLPPVIQLAPEARLPWTDGLCTLPTRTPEEAARVAPEYAAIRSFQHPDHDTDAWPAASRETSPETIP
ncbi:MAG: GFA family protein [Hyphomicrobiaceae bacterium]|nr:GFA family protein [Hyphomicrobiaceae bacterium]